MSANDKQVGGTHYRSPIQHWDFVAANGLDYFQAQITKYVVRFRQKNGLEDLRKARHFLDKLIELEEAAEAERQAIKAGVIPFTGPHPDGSAVRQSRVDPKPCRRCRSETSVGFVSELCGKCFQELEAQL